MRSTNHYSATRNSLMSEETPSRDPVAIQTKQWLGQMPADLQQQALVPPMPTMMSGGV